MATPRAFRPRIVRNRCCTSLSGSALVGSSIISTSAFAASAFTISTTCWFLHRKGLHLFLHGKGTANGIYQFLRAAVHRVPIYKAVRLHAFIAQKDVFCHCKVWEQVELLMDDGNARGARLHGILKVNRLAFIQNATAVVVVYAGENAH